jgi:hypothetical protein
MAAVGAWLSVSSARDFGLVQDARRQTRGPTKLRLRMSVNTWTISRYPIRGYFGLGSGHGAIAAIELSYRMLRDSPRNGRAGGSREDWKGFIAVMDWRTRVAALLVGVARRLERLWDSSVVQWTSQSRVLGRRSNINM